MRTYDYEKAIVADVESYIKENYDWQNELRNDREDFAEKLNDDLWVADAVTGNGSGSYTFNAWKAEENLCHNMELLREACAEFGCDMGSLVERGAETCDVTIRCYLLASAIEKVLDDLEAELPDEEGSEADNEEEFAE